MDGISGFPNTTLTFLSGLSQHNEKPWFEAHRDDYNTGYVDAGRAFVDHMGPRLRTLSPQVQFAPKINGSIMRINRDIRFSKDKTPYKTHLDLWFWHGEKKGWGAPGFYVRITPDLTYIGSGMHIFDKSWLTAYRNAVVDEKCGAGLLRAIKTVEAPGPYAVGGKARKKVPRGYAADHSRADYLLHDGLFAGLELPSAAITEPDFIDICFHHFSAVWPISNWLLTEVEPKIVHKSSGS